MRRAPLLLGALAVAHAAPAVWMWLGGAAFLLPFAVPFVGLTLLAALASAVPHPAGGWTAVALTAVAVPLAVLALLAYLIGLLHLLQAVLALCVALRYSPSRSPSSSR